MWQNLIAVFNREREVGPFKAPLWSWFYFLSLMGNHGNYSRGGRIKLQLRLSENTAYTLNTGRTLPAQAKAVAAPAHPRRRQLPESRLTCHN